MSIITPTYNRAELIKLTIRNVLNQTFGDFELIIVDDGSTDDTAKVVSSFNDARIRYHRQENQGRSVARNTGLTLAKGEYINFLDDDDLLTPEKISRQIEMFRANPAVGVVYSRFNYIDHNGQYLDEVGELPSGVIYNDLVKGCFIAIHAPLIRKEWLDKIGNFDTHLLWDSPQVEDWDFWLRMAKQGALFYCIQEPLVAYRIHAGGLLRNTPAQEKDSILGIFDKVFSDPTIPAELAINKEKILTDHYIYFSALYFANKEWLEAQQNLLFAVNSNRSLLDNPKNLVQTLIDYAFEPRIEDPVEYIKNVFDHLPEECEGLRTCLGEAIAQVAFRAGLREFRKENAEKGKEYLTKAFSVETDYFRDHRFVGDMIEWESRYWIVKNPASFVNQVFSSIPIQSAFSREVREKTLSNVLVTQAFKHYASGDKTEAFLEAIGAVRHHPRWIMNRGMMVILVKSIPSWLASKLSRNGRKQVA